MVVVILSCIKSVNETCSGVTKDVPLVTMVASALAVFKKKLDKDAIKKREQEMN